MGIVKLLMYKMISTNLSTCSSPPRVKNNIDGGTPYNRFPIYEGQIREATNYLLDTQIRWHSNWSAGIDNTWDNEIGVKRDFLVIWQQFRHFYRV